MQKQLRGIVDLLDAATSPSTSPVVNLAPAARDLFQLQVDLTGSPQVVLEGSIDGVLFTPLRPAGEADEIISTDGFYLYVTLPQHIRAVLSGTGSATVRGAAHDGSNG